MTWTISTNPKNHFHHLVFDEEVALDLIQQYSSS